jgi:hypothetical protein
MTGCKELPKCSIVTYSSVAPVMNGTDGPMVYDESIEHGYARKEPHVGQDYGGPLENKNGNDRNECGSDVDVASYMILIVNSIRLKVRVDTLAWGATQVRMRMHRRVEAGRHIPI